MQAAELAGIGVAVTMVEPGHLRNVYLSNAAVELLGGPREELLATSGLNRIAPEVREQTLLRIQQHLRGEDVPVVSETVVLRPDGTRKPLATASHQVVLDGVAVSVSFFWDLTELKAAEARARAEHQRLRGLIEAAPDAIVIIGYDGKAIFVNSAAARLLGVPSAEEVIGQPLETWLRPAAVTTARNRLAALGRGEKLPPQEYSIVRADGIRVVAEAASRPYVFDGQDVILAFARDVTERAELQEQLTRSQRLAALGTLAAGVAHEINNPLTTISLTLDLLESTLARAALAPLERTALRELGEELRDATNRVARIVGDLRMFSHSSSDDEGPAELQDVLEAAIRISAHALRHHAKLERDLPGQLRVVGAAGRLEQVFVNLLINAAQALPSGNPTNTIRLRAYPTEPDTVVVEVTDNGPGIARELVPHLFDPFFTTKAPGEGTGLGLAISHSIVAGCGGRIEVDTEVGRGTTMRVILQREQSASVPTGGPKAGPRLPSPKARVLVIDDEPALGALLKRILEDRHEVDFETVPHSALARLLRGERYDVVLCDVNMPGMTGLDLHERAIAAIPELRTRFAFTTGGLSSPAARERLAASGVPVLAKPFRSADVEALVGTILEATRSQA